MAIYGILLTIVLTLVILFFGAYCIGFLNKNETFKQVPSTFKDPIGLLTEKEKRDSLYSPIIIRPREINAQQYGGRCTNVLYPKANKLGKGEMGSPNASVEAKFYAQRPLLNPDQYYDMVEQMFETMRTQHKNIPDFINPDLFVYQDEFSEGDTYSNVMKYIMKLINKAKSDTMSMKEYAKVDTWGGEHFAYTDEKLFSFSKFSPAENEQNRARQARKHREPKKLIVNFNLYNTLRNISTDVLASVFFAHGKYYFDDIQITTKRKSNMLPGVNLSAGKTGINLNNSNERAPVPQWIYANTLENITFNNKGFHDPNDKNVYIEGGIPDEYKTFINQKDFKNSYWTKFYNAQNLPGGPLYPETSTSKLNTKVLPDFPKPKSWTVNV